MRIFTFFILVMLLFGCLDSDNQKTSTSENPSTTSTQSSTTTTTIRNVLQTTIPPTSTTIIRQTTTIKPTTSTTIRSVIPEKVLENCIGFLTGGGDEIKAVSDVSGGWIRPHPGPFSWGFIEKSEGIYDFKTTDEIAKRAGEIDIGVLATIWPYADWDQEICRSSECEVSKRDIFYPRSKMGRSEGIPKSRCKPCDMDAYTQFLSKLVERYDGDGIDDMPGLKMPIHYWEILNEPSMQAGDMAFFKGRPREYVEILKASYLSIKETCPNCKVVQGGSAGNHPEAQEYWDKVFELGAGDYFDISNIHFIGMGDLKSLNILDFEDLLKKHSINKPIWVTEAEFTSQGDIELGVSGGFQYGAEKIFFVGFGTGHGRLENPGKFKQLYERQKQKCG